MELQVGLGERSYPIIIQAGYLDKIGDDLAGKMIGRKYAIIADDRVAELYGEQLMQSLKTSGLDVKLFTFLHGESSKTLTTIGALASKLASSGFDRNDAIIALGGGVTGDLAGFLASSYMRGIPFVQIPTTLLAQVDSSVGGKTGVDIPEGKNLVGAFYQPRAVYIDIDVLKTLPEKELLGGLGEVIKYGVIRDSNFFDFLATERCAILGLDKTVIEKLVHICCKIKAEVVSEDEREGGVRRILNFGHTIGHAVEAASNFSLIHGFAVSIGMVAASKLAVLAGLLDEKECAEIIKILKQYKMPIEIPKELDRQVIKKYLLTDKKAIGGRVIYVLPTRIGSTYISDSIEEELVDKVLL